MSQGGIYSVLDDERLKGREAFFSGLGTGFDGSWASLLGGEPISSNSEVETYADLGSVPQLANWKSEIPFHELATYKGSLRNLEFASGMLVQKADLRRDKIGRVRTRMGQLGQRAATHWETLLSNLIIAAETDGSKTIDGANDLSVQAYDGQAFFDTDHAFSAGYTTSQTNDLAASDYANLNINTAAAPTVDEATKFMVDLFGHFWTLKDDQGEPTNGDVRNFVVMVGTNALFSPISSALSLQTVSSGTSSAAYGAVQSLGLNVAVRLNPRLSANTTKVYVFAADGATDKPFILQEEVPIQVAEDAGRAFDKAIKVACWGTRAVGFGNWQKAVVATLS